MKKNIYICSILLFFFLQARAQQTFYKTIGGNYSETINDIAFTTDKGFIVAGVRNSSLTASTDMFITKLDINGDLLWGKIIGTANYDNAEAIAATRDGGLAIAGSASDGMSLTKLNSAGTLLWSKRYSAEKYNGAHALIQTLDGGLALAGYTQKDDEGGSSGYIVKTDGSGNIQWSKRIFDYSFYPSVQSIVQTDDSGYACVLNARNLNNFDDIFIVKLDKNGNFVWGRCIGGESTDSPQSVVSTSDGGLAILATSYSFNSLTNADMLLIKLDDNAKLSWSKIIGDTSGSEHGIGLIQTADGGLIAAGKSSTFGEGYDDVYIAKVDLNGNLIYTKTVGTEGSDAAVAVAGRPDGSFTIGGFSDFYSPNNNFEMMLLNFDSNAGICSSTGSGGVAKDAVAKLYNKTIKITNVSTILTNSAVTVSSGGSVTTICSEVLPLKLISFSASKNNTSNILSWISAQEINIKSYNIERSNDGVHFTSIGAVNAKENNALENEYNFMDVAPAKAINYYRLKIINNDGHAEFSITLNVNNSDKLSVRLYTNPVHGNIPLEFSTDRDEPVQIIITGIDGRLYTNMQIMIRNGTAIKNISAALLPAGMYFIKIKSGFDEINIRFIKQ